jgi:hypothetical protein
MKVLEVSVGCMARERGADDNVASMILYFAAIRRTSNSTNKIIPHVPHLPRRPPSHRLTSRTSVARGQAVNWGVSGGRQTWTLQPPRGVLQEAGE